MSISILNRGASGGLKPELIVQAPAQSTIDIIQNNIIIDTYTLGASETTHTFVVKLGTYTVQRTLDTTTTSTEVIVDTVKQYTVEYTYNKVINGDFLNDLEGWTYGGTGTNRRGVTTYNDIIYGYVNADGLNASSYLSQEIDFTGATVFAFDGFVNQGNTASTSKGAVYIDNTAIYSENYGSISSVTHHEIDISNYTGTHTLKFQCTKTGTFGNSTTFIFTNVQVS